MDTEYIYLQLHEVVVNALKPPDSTSCRIFAPASFQMCEAGLAHEQEGLTA